MKQNKSTTESDKEIYVDFDKLNNENNIRLEPKIIQTI